MKRKDDEPKRPVVVPLRAPEPEELEDEAAEVDDEVDEVREAERALAAALARRAEGYTPRDRESAQRDLFEAIRLDPESGAAWHHLSIIEWDHEQALEYADEALRCEPMNAYYYGTRAEIRERLDQLEGALADYDRAVHLDKHRRSALWLGHRARLHDRLGRWDAAWRDFTAAFRRGPQFRWLLHERAQVLVHKGDLTGARRELDRAIDAHPKLLVCVREKALVCHRMGELDEALAAIDRVIAGLAHKDYRDEFDHYIRGAILFARGDTRAALGAFEAGEASDDVCAGPFTLRRAQCLLELGRPQEALAACDVAVRDAPYSEECRLWRARALERLGTTSSLRRALADVRHAIERAPGAARYVAEKAVIHARRGSWQKARDEARSAVRFLRKPQPLPRTYHARVEDLESRGLDVGHAPAVPREVLVALARGARVSWSP